MSKFEAYLQLLTEAKKIGSGEIKKLSTSVRKTIGTKPADKWDDPIKFIHDLVDAIELSGAYTVDEFDVNKIKGNFKNRKSDIYIDVDKGSSGLTFTDKDGKEGYVNVSWYNDPGKNQDSKYEIIYNIG
jgi:hypothetical protein